MFGQLRSVTRDGTHIPITLLRCHCSVRQWIKRSVFNDLQVIGKLENTIVVLTTEFGRTPIPNKNSGRDHYPKAFSSVLAGGGMKGGYCYGRTSSGGEEVEENAVTIPDFNATIATMYSADKELVSSSGDRLP